MKEKITLDKKRVNYFDIAKGIGIILVIIGHIEYVTPEIRYYIVSFHMPMFFVISGMLINLTNEKSRDLKGLVIKKLKRIMLPYLVFSILFPLIDFVYYFVTGNGDPYGTLRTNIMDSLMLYGYSVLWFLPTAFFGEMIFLLVIKTVMKKTEKYAEILALFIIFIIVAAVYFLLGRNPDHFILSFVRFFISAFFTAVGSFTYSIIKERQIRPVIQLSAGLLLLAVLLFTHKSNGIVDMHFAVYGNILLYIINAVIGSFGVIFISMSSEPVSTLMPYRVLEFYGINSLFVMITHINFYILYFAEVLSFKITGYIPIAKDFLFNVFTLVSVLVSEYVLIKIYGRAKRIVHNRALK